MSKHETWRTRKYWEQTGGLLIEEFVVIEKGKGHGKRMIDGVIVLGEKKKLHDKKSFDIKGRDIICIQTKKGRLGMYAMGQAFFSKELLKQHKPKSIKTVVICGKDDVVLNKLCKQFNIEVVIINEQLLTLN
ncbi:MAG: hypothetical protein POELPBGB_03180 [Bacteroidia bacterium]|nr:hypothetical protein [Bacteroidia bacterium]